MRKIPLALKYRPRLWADVVGNEFVIKVLQISARDNDVSNAYFLSGTRGCGKTSAARIFAKAINCSVPSEQGEPCLKCDNCVTIEAQSNLDVLEIDAASQNSVESIRRLTGSIQYAPVQGRYKTVIVDECHCLTFQAASRLLKTLEEPPEFVVFLFCTTEPQKVLDTIRSRCLPLAFKNIQLEEITSRLKFICEQENIATADDALNFIARFAKGGMRDAVSLIDQLSRHGQKLSMEFIREALALINEADVVKFVKLVLEEKEVAATELALELLQDKPVLDFISIIIEVLESVYLFKLGLLAKTEEKIVLKELADLVSRSKILQVVRAARKVVEDARYFFVLSQRATIVFFVSQIFLILKEKSSSAFQSSTPIISNAVVQHFSEVFENVRDVTADGNFLHKFQLEVAHVSPSE